MLLKYAVVARNAGEMEILGYAGWAMLVEICILYAWLGTFREFYVYSGDFVLAILLV